jgi:predicted RNase H-like HicB family nuclease
MNEHTEPIRYTMIIEWDPRDDIFVVTVPELNGCRTHGNTYEEAVQQGQEAIESWRDAVRGWGHDVPPPRYYDHERWTWPEREITREVVPVGD